MALLKVKLKLADGATSGFMKIDRSKVVIDNGVGEKMVTDERDHWLSIWFGGNAPGTVDFEVTQDGASIAKGKVAISFGQVEGRISGPFHLHTVGA